MARAILLGGLVVGILDGLDAAIFWTLRGSSADRVFRAIASGLLGPSAVQAGTGTALLGVALHFLIATGAAAVFVLASRRLPVLLRYAVPAGMVYGLGVHVFMQYVVIPLSAFAGRRGSPSGVVLANLLLAHAFLVGLPIALIARAVLGRPR